MLQGLVSLLYSWLPPGLFLPIAAVIGVAFLIIAVKILTIIFDFLFKFIDIFMWSPVLRPRPWRTVDA